MGFYWTGHHYGIARNDLLDLNAMDNTSGRENCDRAQKRTNQASCRNRPPVPMVAGQLAGEDLPYRQPGEFQYTRSRWRDATWLGNWRRNSRSMAIPEKRLKSIGTARLSRSYLLGRTLPVKWPLAVLSQPRCARKLRQWAKTSSLSEPHRLTWELETRKHPKSLFRALHLNS